MAEFTYSAPNPKTLQVEEAAKHRVLQAIEHQLTAMSNHLRQVEEIDANIRANFAADASTEYQKKLEEWHAGYYSVQSKYQELSEKFGQAHRLLDRAHEDALHQASAWGAGDHITAQLNLH